ncbi:MAG TPA: cation-translocating P-type ATPase [Bdellovibrionota bacterium]|nr:cation-translocating P-type ATPase [Bdellovibrionota bacterium]
MGGQHEHHHQEPSSELISESTDEVVLHVEGMTCGGCASRVRKAAASVSDLVEVDVNLGEKEARILGAGASGIDAQTFASAITKAGYPAKVLRANHAHAPGFWAKWSTMVLVASALTTIMLAGDWALGWQHHGAGRWALFAMATAIQFYTGSAFLKGALRQARLGKSDMDTLVALGSGTAYLYSTWALLAAPQHHLYFAEAGSIISLVSLGHFLEAKMSERAQSSLKKLLSLQHGKILRLDEAGHGTPVSGAQLRVNDVIRVQSGDRIPVDAVTTAGGASLDESAVSGESQPIDKAPGDRLVSGTLVLDGQLDARVTATGRHTALAQIIESVRRAQNSRAQIQKLADRVSSIFVPVVVAVAALAFALWYFAPQAMDTFAASLEPYLWARHVDPSALSQALLCAVGVLIIACPCAMGLATPAALMAGTNRAAAGGVLIRDASAIEKSSTITHVFFDKTGTLTRGELAVTKVLGDKSSQTLALAGALAARSKHPISRAIAAHAPPPGSDALDAFQETRGRGLSARESGGKSLRLGSLAWHRDELKLQSPLFIEAEASSASINVLSRGDEVLAVFFLEDQLKDETPAVIASLRRANIEVGIISGDRKAVVHEMAQRLGLREENVHAEVIPERKAAVIEAHQKRGDAVAFVGDGINDAPALKMATLGIAVSSASDIAKDSADLILIQHDIRQIPWALEISSRTLRTIKQNLFWAFCYNVLAVPLAFAGFVSPIICAAAMGLSDVFVILNSLRLARPFKKDLHR